MVCLNAELKIEVHMSASSVAKNWQPLCCEGNGVGGWFLPGCVIIAEPRLCFLQAGWMAGGWVWIQACVGRVDKNRSTSLAEHLRAGQGIGKSPTQHMSSHALSVEQAKEWSRIQHLPAQSKAAGNASRAQHEGSFSSTGLPDHARPCLHPPGSIHTTGAGVVHLWELWLLQPCAHTYTYARPHTFFVN